MIKIKCPKCGEEITIDKSQYDSLLNEIKTEEVNKAVQERVGIELMKIQTMNESTKANLEREYKEKADKFKEEKKALEFELEKQKIEVDTKVLKATQAIKDDLAKKEQEAALLKSQLESSKKDAQLTEAKLKEDYEHQLKMKDEDLERWKSYRMGDSTKDLGESLEKYCEEKFNEIRTVTYPNAEFIKDNIVDETGKGDYIFRDKVGDIEIASIMFDMKTEKDTTATKHKNEDFFAKLDKNRESKGCEYAVLVSTLEADSQLYNKGIVDVSYKYPKMYVVRPQFFLTFIALIHSMAMKNYESKRQLIEYQRQNTDITNFESMVRQVAEKINTDYENAAKIYDNVDKMCDDIVNKVETFRKGFKTAAGWYEKAKNQLPNLEVRKLTKGNLTMKEKFDALKSSIDNK